MRLANVRRGNCQSGNLDIANIELDSARLDALASMVDVITGARSGDKRSKLGHALRIMPSHDIEHGVGTRDEIEFDV